MFRCLTSIDDAERREPGEVAEHIARAAARLFADRGYDATSVREIVAEAGVTKPTLYYHYGSKEGLGRSLLRGPVSALADRIEALGEATMDPIGRQVAMFEAQLNFCRDEPDRARFMYALVFGPVVGELKAELEGLIGRIDAAELRAARGLAEAGRIAEGRAEDWFMAMKGLVVVRMMEILYRGVGPGPGLAERLVGDLLRGLGVGVTVGTDRSRSG